MWVQYPKLRNMAYTTSLLTFSLILEDQTFIFYSITHNSKKKYKRVLEGANLGLALSKATGRNTNLGRMSTTLPHAYLSAYIQL